MGAAASLDQTALAAAATSASPEDIQNMLDKLPEDARAKVTATILQSAKPKPPEEEEAPPFYPVAPEEGELDQINKVADKLYLSNWRGADDKAQRKKLGITHIAAVGSEFVGDTAKGIKYWRKDIGDDETAEADMGASLRDGANFIQTALKGGGTVLVHCAAGISRSATLVLAYFVLHKKKSLREAFGTVIAARRPVWPNDGFMRALIALEAEVRKKYGGATISIEEYIRWGDYELPPPVPALSASVGSVMSDAAESSSGTPRPALPRLMRGPTFVLEETRHGGGPPPLLTFESTDSIDDSLRLSASGDMRKLLAKNVTMEATEARKLLMSSRREDDSEDEADEKEETEGEAKAEGEATAVGEAKSGDTPSKPSEPKRLKA